MNGRSVSELTPFVEAACRVGSHEGPFVLWEWYIAKRLSGDALAEAVSYAWSSAHLPFTSLGGKQWISFFTEAGYTENGKPADRPETPLTLYRAAEPTYVHRLAWTASLDVAERFLEIHRARYGDRPRHIYTITITDPDRILAHITDRHEDEFIVNTTGLHAKPLETKALVNA